MVTVWGIGRPDYSVIEERISPETLQKKQVSLEALFNYDIPGGYAIALTFDTTSGTILVRDSNNVTSEKSVGFEIVEFKKVFIEADGNGCIGCIFYTYLGNAFFIKYGYGKIESWFPDFMAVTPTFDVYLYNFDQVTHNLKLNIYGVAELKVEDFVSLTEQGYSV